MSLASVFGVPEGNTLVLADPDDDVFLRCAEVAEASYVVFGDRHLLDLAEHAGIPMVTVRDFLAREFPEVPVQPAAVEARHTAAYGATLDIFGTGSLTEGPPKQANSSSARDGI